MPWDLTGNSDTNPETNFLGTRDDQPLVIRTNGAQAVHIDGSGSVGIGGGTFARSHFSISEFGQGSNVLLNLRRIERQVEEGEPPAPGLDVNFILDPTNRVFHLDLGGQDNPRARIHLGDPDRADNPVTTLGNVGIGTTDPQQKLHVVGEIMAVGRIESRTGGFRFPDGTVQTTATLRGPTGSRGPEGPQGPPGVATRSSAVCTTSICSCPGGTVLSRANSPCFVTSDTGSCQVTTPPGTCCVCIA